MATLSTICARLNRSCRPIIALDYLLNHALRNQDRQYRLLKNCKPITYALALPNRAAFLAQHSYFSSACPLVGTVSTDLHEEALRATHLLLDTLSHSVFDKSSQWFALEETLAKIVAYRDLQLNSVLKWRDPHSGKKVEYRVDRCFDLWHGMPAFGLYSPDGATPILLFRGTDFSLKQERGWASLLSDLHPDGPGLNAFMHARPAIHLWLKSMADRGKKAKVIGFSLGGSLAIYTFLYENSWISTEPSVAFNPPGCSDSVFQDWQHLSQERQQDLFTFINRGDPVSKIGKLVGAAHQLSLRKWLPPVHAHTLFFTAESDFLQHPIDLSQENASRKS